MEKTNMYNPADWSVKNEIQKRVEQEAWHEWGKQPIATIKYDYRPVKLQWSETVRYVFAKGIKFIKASRP